MKNQTAFECAQCGQWDHELGELCSGPGTSIIDICGYTSTGCTYWAVTSAEGLPTCENCYNIWNALEISDAEAKYMERYWDVEGMEELEAILENPNISEEEKAAYRVVNHYDTYKALKARTEASKAIKYHVDCWMAGERIYAIGSFKDKSEAQKCHETFINDYIADGASLQEAQHTYILTQL